VIPNADLFTHSVTLNTALDTRRWEYEVNLKGVQNLEDIKSRIVETVSKVPGVLADPKPEALVTDLTDLAASAVKVRVLWWTKAPRHHQMLSSCDEILSAIGQALSHPQADNRSAA
jgi:small conductance mechanosensitive channel